MNNQELFDYMLEQHGVTLLETDIQEIQNIVMKEEREKMVQFADEYADAVMGGCNMRAKEYLDDFIKNQKQWHLPHLRRRKRRPHT